VINRGVRVLVLSVETALAPAWAGLAGMRLGGGFDSVGRWW
jgi:hypothetical protein